MTLVDVVATSIDVYKRQIVSSPSGVDDGSFNQDNYNGVLKFIEENPNATVTPIREETGDSAAAVQAVADVVADYDVIVCCGFQFAGIGNLAQENPDTKFILIDSWPTVDGTEVTADQVIDNVYAAYYAEQESGFYAGMAAALSTTTGKVAVVNGIAYPSNAVSYTHLDVYKRQPFDFFQFMCDQDDSLAVIPQRFDNIQQEIDLLRCQNRCGFIKNEDLRFSVKHL